MGHTVKIQVGGANDGPDQDGGRRGKEKDSRCILQVQVTEFAEAGCGVSREGRTSEGLQNS